MVSRRRIFDALFVSTLILYALAGMVQTPFHGDETTIIYMSRDWATLVQHSDISAIRYQPTYSDDQQLRLVNGVISTYAFGFVWSSFGLKASDLPTAWWWWGANWEINVKQGHLPNANLLFATRLASTFMMVLSISLIFASARLLSKQRWLPYCVTLVYATLPALLLDGRRAMFEGAAMLTSALVIFTALNLARLVRLKLAKAKLITGWILFSVACGFALATKFTTLVVVMAATGMLLLVGWQRPLNRLASVSAIVGAALIFLLLNPAWWAAPVQVFNEVVKDRQNIIKAQVDQYGAYSNLPARIAGLITLPLSAPQYYEDTQNYPDSGGWSAVC